MLNLGMVSFALTKTFIYFLWINTCFHVTPIQILLLLFQIQKDVNQRIVMSAFRHLLDGHRIIAQAQPLLAIAQAGAKI